MQKLCRQTLNIQKGFKILKQKQADFVTFPKIYLHLIGVPPITLLDVSTTKPIIKQSSPMLNDVEMTQVIGFGLNFVMIGILL